MAEVYREDPGRQPHNGSNSPLDATRCKAGVWSNERWSKYSQCARKAGVDGWCKQHHPEAESERAEASKEKYDRKTRRRMMGYLGEGFMAALIKIRDGDNDPRQTAADALASCRYAEKRTGIAEEGNG